MKNELVSSLKQIAFSGMGVVAGLIEKPGPGIHASRQRVEVKKGTGCTGDHHKKDFWKGERIPGREITMFSAEVAHVLGADPLVVGDNIISEGLNLSDLEADDLISIGTVVLRRSEKTHRPCALFAERISPAARKAVLEANMRGALFFVEKEGSIQVGDAITINPFIKT